MTDDPIEAAYFGVYVWKAAAEKAGSFDVDKVRDAVYGMKFDAPGGKKKMDPKNQHTWKPVYVGEIKKDGQFKIIYKTPDLVAPDSYSRYLHPDPRRFRPPPAGRRSNYRRNSDYQPTGLGLWSGTASPTGWTSLWLCDNLPSCGFRQGSGRLFLCCATHDNEQVIERGRALSDKAMLDAEIVAARRPSLFFRTPQRALR